MNAKQFMTETSNTKLIKRLRAVQNNIQLFKIHQTYIPYIYTQLHSITYQINFTELLNIL